MTLISFIHNNIGNSDYLVDLALRERSFLTEYRLDPQSFDLLVEYLSPALHANQAMSSLAMNQCGSQMISVASRVGAGLIILGGGRPMESMRTHGLAKTTVYTNFVKFLDAVNTCHNLDIIYDYSYAGVAKYANDFKRRSTHEVFKHCCGAIDGIAIRIRCPKNVLNQGHYYSGNKKYYCVNMQAVCDANCLFTGVSVKHVGSTNDSIAFQNSSLVEIISRLPYPFHWLGDNAYVDSSTMITPYPGTNLKTDYPAKDWFNFWQSQLRITIERCFGIFVMRWGILWKSLDYDLPMVMKIIQACCRLHNFATQRNISLISQTNTPPVAEVNEAGALVDRRWRDLIAGDYFPADRNTKVGSTLKNRILEMIEDNHYSHDRNISF